MSFETPEEISEIKKKTQDAAKMACSELSEIQSLLYRANTLYESLDSDIKVALNDYHRENTSLGHCLRWGNSAVDDLVGLI